MLVAGCREGFAGLLLIEDVIARGRGAGGCSLLLLWRHTAGEGGSQCLLLMVREGGRWGVVIGAQKEESGGGLACLLAGGFI